MACGQATFLEMIAPFGKSIFPEISILTYLARVFVCALLRWTPKIGQEGSLSPNPRENDPHVQETTSA